MKNNKAMSNAERQADYRARLKDSEGSRFSVVLSGFATEQLKRITEDTGWTKKKAIEAALLHYDLTTG